MPCMETRPATRQPPRRPHVSLLLSYRLKVAHVSVSTDSWGAKHRWTHSWKFTTKWKKTLDECFLAKFFLFWRRKVIGDVVLSCCTGQVCDWDCGWLDSAGISHLILIIHPQCPYPLLATCGSLMWSTVLPSWAGTRQLKMLTAIGLDMSLLEESKQTRWGQIDWWSTCPESFIQAFFCVFCYPCFFSKNFTIYIYLTSLMQQSISQLLQKFEIVMAA